MYDNHEKIPLPEVMYLRDTELVAAEHVADSSFAHVLRQEPAKQVLTEYPEQTYQPAPEPAPVEAAVTGEKDLAAVRKWIKDIHAA